MNNVSIVYNVYLFQGEGGWSLIIHVISKIQYIALLE